MNDSRTALFWALVFLAAGCFAYVWLVGCDIWWPWDVEGDPHLVPWLGAGLLATLASELVDR